MTPEQYANWRAGLIGAEADPVVCGLVILGAVAVVLGLLWARRKR